MNKELNIGDYVRTKGGNIFKIIGGNPDNWEIDISCIQLEQIEENWYESNRYNDNGYWFTDENIIKSSPNIIDLIEVGDYVNGRKVYQIGYNAYDDFALKMSESNYEDFIYQQDIKSIVTKERFESIEYKC